MVAVAGKSAVYGCDDTIRELFNAGQSDNAIARHLSIELQKPITRLAVLGYRHRMGLKREAGARPMNFHAKQYKTNVLPFRKSIINTPEPEAIGPLEDFPACGCCRYTSDNPLQPNWKMCGQPVDTKRRGDNYPWCDWHRDHVIYNPQAEASA
jgi:hypothetical protein